MIVETAQLCWWERGILCVSPFGLNCWAVSPPPHHSKGECVFSSSVSPNEQGRGLSLALFHLCNFTACFPCWDVPLWIGQCCSFIRRSHLNCMSHVSIWQGFSPFIPKAHWREMWELYCTQVFFRVGLHAWFCVLRPGVVDGSGGARRAACCSSSPSARLGSLQALLLLFSHPCSWAFYTFQLRTAIFLTCSWGRDRNICRDCHRLREALKQFRFVWKTYFCLSQCLIIYIDRFLFGVQCSMDPVFHGSSLWVGGVFPPVLACTPAAQILFLTA